MAVDESEKDKLSHKTRQSFIWFTSIPFFIHSVRFANSIILARILSPSDFGIMGIISVILFYCDTYSDMGFGKAVIELECTSAGGNRFGSRLVGGQPPQSPAQLVQLSSPSQTESPHTGPQLPSSSIDRNVPLHR